MKGLYLLLKGNKPCYEFPPYKTKKKKISVHVMCNKGSILLCVMRMRKIDFSFLLSKVNIPFDVFCDAYKVVLMIDSQIFFWENNCESSCL